MAYDEERPEIVELVPSSTRRLLDVGCATGRFAAELRGRFPEIELWGIDPTPPDNAAASIFDQRIVGRFPDDLPADEQFDCIVFNDVLEHMAEPWDALRRTHSLLRPRAAVIASIPNVRHIWVLRQLVLHGRWDYTSSGILDRTHLRFFTRATAGELFTTTGYHIERVAPIRIVGNTGKIALVNKLLRGRLNDLFTERYAIVAREEFLTSTSPAPER